MADLALVSSPVITSFSAFCDLAKLACAILASFFKSVRPLVFSTSASCVFVALSFFSTSSLSSFVLYFFASFSSASSLVISASFAVFSVAISASLAATAAPVEITAVVFMTCSPLALCRSLPTSAFCSATIFPIVSSTALLPASVFISIIPRLLPNLISRFFFSLSAASFRSTYPLSFPPPSP